MALLFVQAHWAMWSAVAVMVARVFVVPVVEPWVKAHWPRVAHFCAAVAAMSPDLIVALKALYRAFVGQPWPEASK